MAEANVTPFWMEISTIQATKHFHEGKKKKTIKARKHSYMIIIYVTSSDSGKCVERAQMTKQITVNKKHIWVKGKWIFFA